MRTTVTINGSTYEADYNPLTCNLDGFDSNDAFYNIFVENERPIMRVVSAAYDAENCTAEYKNISATVYPL